jgi:hypothetical protein
LTAQRMCRADETICPPAVDVDLAFQGQMSTVHHLSEVELTIAHLLTHIRSFVWKAKIFLPRAYGGSKDKRVNTSEYPVCNLNIERISTGGPLLSRYR